MRLLLALVATFAFLHDVGCQIHYVPAQILIPTFNGTHIASNHSIYNVYNNSRPINNSGPTYQNGVNDAHLMVGEVRYLDRLLFNQEYFKAARWWADREKIIEFPNDLPAGYFRQETISCVRVYNKFLDGSSARAKIIKGGVNNQYVKIQLHSNRGKGFRFLVQIFGH